jgi:hypothetical protein
VQPAALLQLLLADPRFAWLRAISELIVQIDEVSEAEEPPTPQQADELVRLVRRLLTETDDRSEFARHYAETMERQPTLLTLHGRVISAVDLARG